MIPPAPIAPQPNVPVHYVKAEAGEVITLGNVKLRVLEDGSRTGMCFFLLFPRGFPESSSSYLISRELVLETIGNDQ